MSIASAPFNKPSADLILQTSDNFQFNVWKVILMEASIVFADMFTLDEIPHGSASDGAASHQAPAVKLTETSAALDGFLRMCYPPPHPTFTSIDALRSVMAVAHKYQADGVFQVLKEALVRNFAATQPVLVYAIAVYFDLANVARTAARHFLAVPSPAPPPPSELSEDINVAGAYQRLLAYRRQCSDAISDMVQSRLAWLPQGAWQFLTCTHCPPSAVTSFYPGSSGSGQPLPAHAQVPRMWFWNHHERMGELLRERPCAAALKRPSLLEQGIVEVAPTCGNCRFSAPRLLRLFNKELGKEVRRRIAQVSSPWFSGPR
ncbi:uncharacterized protein BXZ73DRAFT_55648 [Epithele typhae]|uniref:uncharacterized protein n=1 Tax=Epithele typhae TaxID=378194 RepID=UPI0020086C3C|nr:uncharacterized protein BXZ73DRAFT_55648 [Epithele typhae]KAH9913130.1 hypothetical protein BXZ73DRAFT_55648 [Epithele typhae]